jgi:hypothetical protein
MIRYGELIQALRDYTHTDVSNEISDENYRVVIKLAIRKNRMDQQWDLRHICAVLLYIAFNEGQLHPSQLNSKGLEALDWAEQLIENNEIPAAWLKKEKKQLASA